MPVRLSTLQTALLASLGVHAALLGVRLADPAAFDRMFESSPLDVVLVASRSEEAPVQAQALAQVSLAGGGDAAAGRATSPLPPMPQAESGDASEETRRQAERIRETEQQLLTRLRREAAALPATDLPRSDGSPAEREQEDRRRQLAQTIGEIEKRISDDNAKPRRRYVGPATREVAYALYYDRMRRRIEERGTRNFPESRGRKLYGELTMRVTVDADGRVVDAAVVDGSGLPALDRRAQAIVAAAAPFGRFDAGMRREADQIVVDSRFRFTRDEGLATTLGARP